MRRRLSPHSRRPRRSGSAQRGIALLMVLIFLAMLGSVVADFQYNSSIDLEMAYNARDELQAESSALSALRLRALLLKHSQTLQTAINQLGVGALLGGSGHLPIGQLLQSIPVECGLMSAITRTGGSDFADDSDSDSSDSGSAGSSKSSDSKSQGDFFRGECMATSQSEQSKISLNMLRTSSNGAARNVQQLLLGILSDPALKDQFQEGDDSGNYAASPAALVGNIIDWIDDNDTQELNPAGDEDRLYQYLSDPYKAKNAPFDSVAELQLVYGMNDTLYNVLKNHVTVNTDNSRIELGTADDEMIVMGLMSCLREGITPDQVILLKTQIGLFMRALNDVRTLGGPAFAVLNINTLRGLLQQSGLDSVIDPSRLSQVFSNQQGSTWYTINAQGRVGNASVRIKVIFQAQEGRFYYARIE